MVVAEFFEGSLVAVVDGKGKTYLLCGNYTNNHEPLVIDNVGFIASVGSSLFPCIEDSRHRGMGGLGFFSIWGIGDRSRMIMLPLILYV